MTALTRIVPWGGSSGIRIPKDLLKAARLSTYDDVKISVESNGVIVIAATTPPKARYRHKTIQERFADFDGEIPPLDEVDFGPDIGDEIWR
jgi:antitoxin MazE